MASRRFDAVKTQGLQRVRIGGSFRPAGTGAPTNIVGQGFAVARTGVGAYDITFDDSFVALDECQACAREKDGNAVTVTFGTWTKGTRVLQLNVFKDDGSSGVPAANDLAADPDNVINFSAVFRNTSVDY